MNRVNPSYYKGSVECIEAIKASMTGTEYAGFLKGQVIKYVWRYANKNGLEDLVKAEWYMSRLIKEQAKKEVKDEIRRDK